MINHEGKIIENAYPSSPVEILGLKEPANAGNEFLVVKNEDEAKKISDFKKSGIRENKISISRIKQIYLKKTQKKN